MLTSEGYTRMSLQPRPTLSETWGSPIAAESIHTFQKSSCVSPGQNNNNSTLTPHTISPTTRPRLWISYSGSIKYDAFPDIFDSKSQ